MIEVFSILYLSQECLCPFGFLIFVVVIWSTTRLELFGVAILLRQQWRCFCVCFCVNSRCHCYDVVKIRLPITRDAFLLYMYSALGIYGVMC